MKISFKSFGIILMSVFLVAWSFGEKKPDKGNLKSAFKMNTLPGYIQLLDFDVDVLENMGNKVDPKWGSRFKAVVKSKIPLYAFDTKKKNIIFVELKNKKGTKAEVYGKIVSTLYQGKWKHYFELEGRPFSKLGIPLDDFDGKKILIRGSKEEQTYFDKIRAAKANVEHFRVSPRDTNISNKLCVSMKKRAEYRITSSGSYKQFWGNGSERYGRNISYKGIPYESISKQASQIMPISSATDSYGALIVKIDNASIWQLVKKKTVVRGQKVCLDINIPQTKDEYSAIDGYLSVTIEENL